MTEKRSKLEKTIEQQGLSEQEAAHALKQLSTPQKKHRTHTHKWNPKVVKIGILPDTHIGSKFFDEDIYMHSVEVFNRDNVDAVYHVGDIIEGMSNREGHVYELDIVGVTPQVNRACELLGEIHADVYFLEGNHHEWARRKSNQGVEIGRMIEDGVDGVHKIGDMSADIRLADDLTMRLTHEGNTCYAISYSGQKRINATEGGTKPNVWVNGHIHKSMYMQYRNIHYFEAGCMQRQTPFMAMKGSPAMLGFWRLDMAIQDGQLAELTPKWYPHY